MYRLHCLSRPIENQKRDEISPGEGKALPQSMGDIMTAIIDKLRAFGAAFLVVAALSGSLCPAYAQGQTQRPNIVFIMGDDIGWANPELYNQGIMAGRTPNLDQLASQGMRFTDYYAEASCTAVAQTLSLASYRSAPGSPLSVKQVRRLVCPMKRRPLRRSSNPWVMRPASLASTTLPTATTSCRPSRVRRVLRLSVLLGCDGGPRPPQLPAGTQDVGRTAQHGP